MKMTLCLFYIIFFRMLFSLSCSHIREFNTTPASDEIKLKKAIFVTDSLETVEATYVILNKDSSTITYKVKEQDKIYNLNQIQSLTYSNTNLRLPGFFLGAIVGGVICRNIFDKPEEEKKSTNNYGDDFIISGAFPTITEIIAIPTIIILNMYIGHRIGSHFYIRWQKYPLYDSLRNESLYLYTPANTTMLLGIKIPIY